MALKLSSKSAIWRRPSIASTRSGSTWRRACSASERLNNFDSFSSWSIGFHLPKYFDRPGFPRSVLPGFISAPLDAGPSDAVPFSFIVPRFASREACLHLAVPQTIGNGTGEHPPFPVQAVWCILLSSRKVKRDIQELSVSVLRVESAGFGIAGSASPLTRLRILHGRGNNANKNYHTDCRS